MATFVLLELFFCLSSIQHKSQLCVELFSERSQKKKTISDYSDNFNGLQDPQTQDCKIWVLTLVHFLGSVQMLTVERRLSETIGAGSVWINNSGKTWFFVKLRTTSWLALTAHLQESCVNCLLMSNFWFSAVFIIFLRNLPICVRFMTQVVYFGAGSGWSSGWVKVTPPTACLAN